MTSNNRNPPTLPDQSHYMFKIWRPWYPDQSFEYDIEEQQTKGNIGDTPPPPPIDLGKHLSKKLFNMDYDQEQRDHHQKEEKKEELVTKEKLEFLQTMFPDLDSETLELLLHDCVGDVQKIADTLMEPLNYQIPPEEDDDFDHPFESSEEETLKVGNKIIVVDKSKNKIPSTSTTSTTTSSSTITTKQQNKSKLKTKPQQKIKQHQQQQQQQKKKNEIIINQEVQPSYSPPSPPHQEQQEEEKKLDIAQQNEIYRNLMSTLQEMFGEVSRQNIAMILDQNNFDLDKSIETLLSFDPETYKQQLELEQSTKKQREKEKEKEKEKDSPKSRSTPNYRQSTPAVKNIIKEQEKDSIENPTPVYKYVSTKSHSPSNNSINSKLELVDDEHNFDDFNAKLILDNRHEKKDEDKLNKLISRFPMASREIIEEIYTQSNQNLQSTWKVLAELFPIDTRTLASKIRRNQNNTNNNKNIINNNNQSTTTADLLRPPKIQEDDPNRMNILPSEPQKVEIYNIQKQDQKPIRVGSKKTPKNTPPIQYYRPTHELNSKNYQEFRGEASKYALLRNTYFQQASAAYMKGKQAEANQLASQGSYYDKLVKQANANAANQIFMSCNSRINDTLKIDLHGLHVAEALEMVSEILDIHTRGEYENEGQQRPSRIELITGAGNHSHGGVAKIKPALIALLKECRLSFDDLGGVLSVKIK